MKVNREGLVEQLSQLRPALATGGVVEMGMFWFEGDHVCAYDGELGIRMRLNSGLKLGVGGLVLLQLLSGASAKEVSLEPDGATLKVQAGRSRNLLPTAPIERCPWPRAKDGGGYRPDIPKNTPVLTLTEPVLDALARALLITVSKPVRTEHHGVMVEAVNGGVAFYTTDSTAMSELQVKVPLPKEFVHVLLLRRFVEQLTKNCAEGDKLYLLKDCLAALGDGIAIYSNLLDTEDVVNFSKVVAKYAKNNGAVAEVPAGFGESLDNAQILGGSAATVKFSVKDRTASIKGSFPAGQLSHDLPLKEKLPAVSAVLAVAHMRAVLDEAETFSLAENAIVLQGGDDFLFVLASAD